MTKEQEEAIKYFEDKIKVHREQIDKLKEEGQFEGNGTMIDIYKLRICMITIILNMLKEKDAEIQFQKDINKQEKDRHKQVEKSLKGQIKKKDEKLKIYKELKDIVNSKVTDLLKLKQYDDLKKKVDRQDKMIDLMAEYISDLDIDEEICKHQVQAFCDNKPEGVTLDVCAKCIKQYFEKQAKEKGE